MSTFNRFQKLFGIGPIGAGITFVLLAAFMGLNSFFGHPEILRNPLPLRIAGAGLVVMGLGLHVWSMWTLRRWWLDDQLCVAGPFKWFRHPMYAAWVTFILPGLALILNSRVVLAGVVLIHSIWHLLVSWEEKKLLEIFQDEYRLYSKRTGRFFPRIGKA